MHRLEHIIRNHHLEEGFKLLTQREKEIITLYYLEGYIDREIAAYYQVTRENIAKLRKKGLKKLKTTGNI